MQIEIRRRRPHDGFLALPRHDICRHCGSVADLQPAWGILTSGHQQVGVFGDYVCPKKHHWRARRRGAREFRFRDDEWAYFSRLGGSLK